MSREFSDWGTTRHEWDGTEWCTTTYVHSTQVQFIWATLNKSYISTSLQFWKLFTTTRGEDGPQAIFIYASRKVPVSPEARRIHGRKWGWSGQFEFSRRVRSQFCGILVSKIFQRLLAPENMHYHCPQPVSSSFSFMHHMNTCRFPPCGKIGDPRVLQNLGRTCSTCLPSCKVHKICCKIASARRKKWKYNTRKSVSPRFQNTRRVVPFDLGTWFLLRTTTSLPQPSLTQKCLLRQGSKEIASHET